MGVEEDPLARLNVTDDFARKYVEQGGSPATVGDVDSTLAESPRSDRGRIFYRGSSVVVTDRVFRTSAGHGASYPISELSEIQLVRHSSFKYGGLWAGAALIPIFAVVYGFITDFSISGMALIAAVTTAVEVALFLLAGRAKHFYRILGIYRGSLVLVYETNDARELNQVHRALIRAVEVNGPLRSE
jgi:hypothetical protein